MPTETPRAHRATRLATSRGTLATLAACALVALAGLTACEAATASCDSLDGAGAPLFGDGAGGGGSGSGGDGQYPGQYPGWVDPNDPYTSWDSDHAALTASSGPVNDVGDGPDANGCYACALECKVGEGAAMPNGGVVRGFSARGHGEACGVARTRAVAMAGPHLEGCRDLGSVVKAQPSVGGGESGELHALPRDSASGSDLEQHR